MNVTLLYNAPLLGLDDPDRVSEAGVLESVEALTVALKSRGHRVRSEAAGTSVLDLVQRLSADSSGVVFNLCEGFAGRSANEAHIAGLLELLGIAFTGSPAECLSLVLDKVRTKRLLLACGISTPEFLCICRQDPIPNRELAKLMGKGPVIVKPAREDASLGIGPENVVCELPALLSQVDRIGATYDDVLVEQFIDGREFNVSVLGLGEPECLPLAEIEFQTGDHLPWRVVTYQSKWETGSPADRATEVRCPANIEPELAERIRSVALRAFAVTGCRDYARVDLRMNEQGQIFVLEVNANPDIGPSAGFARALAAGSISYADFAQRLFEQSAQRKTPNKKSVSRDAVRESAVNADAVILRGVEPTEVDQLVAMVVACDMFREDEIAIAREVLEEAIKSGPQGGYRVVVAQHGNEPVGWACYGKVPLTDATYDLYWIVVGPRWQSNGIGRQLVERVESDMRAAGGRWLLAETSSTDAYVKTRVFYLRRQFQIMGEVPEFYRSGDGRVTFGKRLD